LDYVDVTSTLRAPSIGKVRIGKVSEDTTQDECRFEDFWKVYPKKTSKKLCSDLWKKKNLDSHVDEILTFIEKAKLTDRWTRGFVKNPETFIRQECWNDDLSAYGATSTIATYKNKTGENMVDKIRAKHNLK
jgi:hypothetical protein